MAPLHPPIICRAKAPTTRFLYVSCCSPTRTPTLSRAASYPRHSHSSGPTTRSRRHSAHLYTVHLHGHGRYHIPFRVLARLRPTRTTGGHLPLYTIRPPSTGTALVMGPSPAQADPDPKTSLSRPSGVDLELVTVLTQITPHLSPKCQSLQRPGGTLSRRQVPVPASPMMLHLDTTTSASSPVEGTWCESHTMAPAVCISNPSNGTHNCRPGWRTCWVRLPSAAYRSTHTLAYEPSRAAPMKAQVRLASPPERRGGFGTCGWMRCGQAQFRATDSSRRRLAGTSPR